MKLEELVSLCQFKSFPFDLKPSLSPEVWAGRHDFLQELNYLRKNVIEDRLAEFGIITGTYGSGKSQALLHLRYLIQRDMQANDYEVLCPYIPNPCGLGPKQSFIENYQYIIAQGIGQKNIQAICRGAKAVIQAAVSDTKTKEELTALISDETARTALNKSKYHEFMTDPPIPYEVLDSLIAGESQSWEWLSGQKPVGSVGRITVQPMTSHTVCARTLANLIILATQSPTPSKASPFRAVFLLVDQIENLIELGAKVYQEMVAGWRTLIDEVGKGFCILYAMDGKSQDILSILGEPLETRLTIDPNKLSLDVMYDDEPVEFLKQIITSFRITGAELPSDIYPFTEKALDEIVALTSTPLPRNLLTACRRVFTRAAADDRVRTIEDVIDADDVTATI